MHVIAIPQLSDNYAYLVIDSDTRQAGVVDCAEADPVLAQVERQGVHLRAAHGHVEELMCQADGVEPDAQLTGRNVIGAGCRICSGAQLSECVLWRHVTVGTTPSNAVRVDRLNTFHVSSV